MPHLFNKKQVINDLNETVSIKDQSESK